MSIRDFLTSSLMVMMASLCCIHAQTMPTGCSYDSGLYTCDCSNLTSNSLLPLQVTSFNPVPQRLRLNNLPASLSTAILHENFQNISTDKLALQYFMDNCQTVAATCSNGVVLLDSCLTPIDLTGYSLGLVSFILGWVVLGLTIHTRKSAVHPAPGGKKPGNKTKLQNFKEPASKKGRSK